MYHASVNIRSLLIGTLFLGALAPSHANAMRSAEWSFAGETFESGWEVAGDPSLTSTPEGLRISTTVRSLFGRSVSTADPIDTISLDYKADDYIEAGIYWHEKGRDNDDLTKASLRLAPTNGVGSIYLDMTKYERWERRTDFIGIGLPADSELIINRLRVQGWNPVEKLLVALRSFWTFDSIRPSSINFLWGPHIAFTPIGREMMFKSTPPMEQSANRYFYIVMGIAVAWTVYGIKKYPARKKKAMSTLAGVMAALWITYDIRMGTEFLWNAKHDYDTYLSKPIGQRTFRERSFFTDFAAGAASLVQDRKEYVFLAPQRWPYLGLIRYYTYPIVPTEPEQDGTKDTWVVYKRPDVILNPKNQLESRGVVLTRPGGILHEFETGTFIFREQS
ncbi:hypothetical protein COU78_01285 [Candidatus Peregrinibacteria bacterium CG10_big_fil_rev_8_21_14_0_10_49_24]|nr:MAG: hypothetical protein COV83_04250 [Candidatus Peregrinibacteria bacterium CG11_big_fil_rev_8_21_14_0_20_49_14]PIR51359.1 MAG: hypothetical protein COU78_01285 [Candidatus Peregrinibacteria bacterium CG10_big_fil_rev_8_21_14_0_10_49_24]PJA68123.1 MAG: hypothetical protein CO157_01100 [Candidatus Peregrinibacteria bacterium CG_4_9_14_3_um_filter_49_12]